MRSHAATLPIFSPSKPWIFLCIVDSSSLWISIMHYRQIKWLLKVLFGIRNTAWGLSFFFFFSSCSGASSVLSIEYWSSGLFLCFPRLWTRDRLIAASLESLIPHLFWGPWKMNWIVMIGWVRCQTCPGWCLRSLHLLQHQAYIGPKILSIWLIVQSLCLI